MTYEEGLALLGKKIILKEEGEKGLEIISFNLPDEVVIVKVDNPSANCWGVKNLKLNDYNYESLAKEFKIKFRCAEISNLVFAKSLQEKIKSFKL